MALPAVNQFITSPSSGANLQSQTGAFNPLSLCRHVNNSLEGTANWNGQTFTIGAGNCPYHYVPADRYRVSYCIVNYGGGGNNIYVISDQFGGCEWHILHCAGTNTLAFLHVFRGAQTYGGAQLTDTYGYAQNWIVEDRFRSAGIVRTMGDQQTTNLAFSCITPGNPPVIQTTFCSLGALDTNRNPPSAQVLVLDDGTGPNPPNNNLQIVAQSKACILF